ncbi:MAG: hypothetical protein QGH45_20105, partial [Myxococcota bacterium]|nr:hypothetical protein [Myxococcota bacterium]
MAPRAHTPLVPLLAIVLVAPGCRRPPEPVGTDPVADGPITPRKVAPHDVDEAQGICGAIMAAPYRSRPREAGSNQFDPSGIAAVGDRVWLANDRECREQVPPGGGGLYILEPESGGVTAVPVPGYDDKSRKFEALAWDGRELHAIGNVGDRKDNTFLFSLPLDPQTGEIAGSARWHDLAGGLGAATGLGRKPWDHGIKIEGLAALAPGELLIGLRTTGDGAAVRGYRTVLSPANEPPEPLLLEPVPALEGLDLGVAAGGPERRWRMARELSGLADPAGGGGVVLGIASAEFEEGDDWAFLSNALFAHWPADDRAGRLCTFDDGHKIESIDWWVDPPAGGTGTLLLLYDNDSEAVGGYRVVPDVAPPA